MILPLYFLIAATLQPSLETQIRPLEKLSDYKFFVGELSALQPADGVMPYVLGMPLFSNYAEKARFIRLPNGTKISYNDSVAFSFPVGTYLIKNFFYFDDFRKPSKGRRILETRLLRFDGKEWEALPYIWNEEQTEAYYDVAGMNITVDYLDAKGKHISTGYRIPNKNECKGCHSRAGKLMPLGPTARNLNTKNMYASSNTVNQLDHWKVRGWLEGNLEGVKDLPVFHDALGTLETRARAYLDVNCGNCHNRLGPANTSGLFLDWKETNPTHLGVMKSPVAAGRGSGGLSFDIEPGHPERSILVYRMKALDPGIAMPEIGREQIHKEGVKLIEDWIKTMKK